MPEGQASFHIVNLGCKVNRVEADSMAAAFGARGMASAAEEAADLIVVNTCTVTGEAEKKARKAVRRALAVNPVADVVVTGCAAAISPEVFLNMDSRVRVMGKAEIEGLLDAGEPPGAQSAESAGDPKDLAPDGASVALPDRGEPLRIGRGFRTRVGVKVQDGCDHACTYCIVHVARGPARSRDAGKVVAEARSYFDAGVKEVVLTGIDIGAYRSGEAGLPELCDMLVEQADRAILASAPDVHPARIRISSIEPANVTDDFIDMLARHGGRVCRHLHLPLQSGSSKVLREMDRPYTAEEFASLVRKIRARVPGISLSTDVIVGFPGETEADFQDTCALVRDAGFSRLHVFPYSRREGTPAAERADQIPPDVKRDRAARLRAIGKQLAAADLAARAGTVELAIVEGENCLTESYHELPAPQDARPGALIEVSMS